MGYVNKFMIATLSVTGVMLGAAGVSHAVPPVGGEDFYSVDEGVKLNATTVLSNDTDLETPQSGLTAVHLPYYLGQGVSNGTLNFDVYDGTFEYTHNGSNSRTDSFTYFVYDEENLSDEVLVTIDINPSNDLPVADDISIATDTQASVRGLLRGGDEESPQLTYHIVTDGTLGTATIDDINLGTFTYTPNSSAGVDSFSYVVNDGVQDSAIATVNVTVSTHITPTNYIVSKQADTNDGTCDADCSLREAIIAANTTLGIDEITLPAGEYPITLVGGGEDLGYTGDFDITESIIINGAGRELTTLNGMGHDRLLQVNQGEGATPISVTVSNMTLRNGSDADSLGGSGVNFVSDGLLTLENVKFTKNTSGYYGGAVSMGENARLIVESSIFTENCSSAGSAIGGNGTWFINQTTFTDHGGFFIPDQGDGYDCLILQGGGALYQNFGYVTINRSTMTGNSVSSNTWGGGAIHAHVGKLNIYNSTISDNSSQTRGGAIDNQFTDVVIVNSTIVNNTATDSGGGLQAAPWSQYVNTSGFKIANTILANNQSATGVDCYGLVVSEGASLIGDASGCEYSASTGDLAGDPGLGTFVDDGTAGHGHFPLLETSQALDAGDGSQCMPYDQLSTPRSFDGNNDGIPQCDIGSYEYENTNTPLFIDTHYQTVSTWVSGASGSEYSRGLDHDASNNLYVAGKFVNTVDFDPTSGVDSHTSTSGNDLFIRKTLADGSYAWTRTMGGDNVADVLSVAADNYGNVYVAGYFKGNFDFNPSGGGALHSGNGAHDAFLVKYSTTGVFQWAKTFGASNYDQGKSVATDAQNNVYFSYEKPINAYGWYTYLKKYSPNGTELNSYTYYRISILDMALDDTNNLYLTGASYNGLQDFDPTTGSDMQGGGASRTPYLSKLNSDGSYGWTKPLVSGDYSIGKAVTVNDAGIYVGGWFRSSIAMDPNSTIGDLTAVNGDEAFIGAYELNGDYRWSHMISGYNNSADSFTDIQTGLGNDVFAAGIDGPSSSMLAKFDAGAGYVERTGMAKGINHGLSIDNAGNMVMAGGVYGLGSWGSYASVDVDPLATYAARSVRYYDAYVTVMKVDQDGDGVLDESDTYPNDPNQW